MEIYVVREESSKLKLKQKLIRGLYFAGIYFVPFFCLKLFRPTQHQWSSGLSGIALEALFWSVGMGLCMGFLRPKQLRNYKLLVDYDSMTSITEHKLWERWSETRRTIRKGRVRTILPYKGNFASAGGILVSERSKWKARIWAGWVYIPNTLPEYDDLRLLAESWRMTDPTD